MPCNKCKAYRSSQLYCVRKVVVYLLFTTIWHQRIIEVQKYFPGTMHCSVPHIKFCWDLWLMCLMTKVTSAKNENVSWFLLFPILDNLVTGKDKRVASWSPCVRFRNYRSSQLYVILFSQGVEVLTDLFRVVEAAFPSFEVRDED